MQRLHVCGDTKASKEVNFTVQQSDGKVAVSVEPFQFKAN